MQNTTFRDAPLSTSLSSQVIVLERFGGSNVCEKRTMLLCYLIVLSAYFVRVGCSWDYTKLHFVRIKEFAFRCALVGNGGTFYFMQSVIS